MTEALKRYYAGKKLIISPRLQVRHLTRFPNNSNVSRETLLSFPRPSRCLKKTGAAAPVFCFT
jgi:hypothetical protein